MSYRDEAKTSKAGKVSRILGSGSNGTSESVMAAEGARGTPTVARADALPNRVGGKATKGRLDRPARARGGSVKRGKTNVTVIVAPQGGSPTPGVSVGSGAPAMPSMGAPAGPAMPPAPPQGMPPRPPMMPPAGGPPMPMRKRGGRVKRAAGGMTAGGGSGVGRLEKSGME